MKSVSIFNEKGGVGKSLHTMMFGSYLAYECGAKVLVVDFEFPKSRIPGIREEEILQLKDKDSALSRYFLEHGSPKNFYTVLAPLDNGFFEYSAENSAALIDNFRMVLRKDEFDYVIFDFPGLLAKNTPVYDFCSNGLIDLVAVPFDTEPMTRKSALLTCAFMKKFRTDVVAFWNNVTAAELGMPGLFNVGNIIFDRYGIEVLEPKIRSFVKARRDSSQKLFVRSTVCWPERYIEMACPSLKELYAELKRRLDEK